ncbi:MAG: hypothetical protein EA426_06480 [Spirochaetaceae bacterium]|nr:MAG: hypothetical protein EA426_06480 [Spirochaetaceae bacterium]
METRYYLTVYPLEALIASQLDPVQFGQYMAIGRKYGSFEEIMFAELSGGFGTVFDWRYAKERCVAHADGEPKHSVWLSVYRVLENTPLSALKSLYLTTKDGRTLELERGAYAPPKNPNDYWVYQELCPITPLVVSALDPHTFSEYLTDSKNKVSVPKIVFTDLKTVDLETYTNTGNIGAAYDKNLDHLKECILSVRGSEDKPNKNVERSIASFSYQIINHGVYVSDGTTIVQYTMLTVDDIRRRHYDWGRSAMIL